VQDSGDAEPSLALSGEVNAIAGCTIATGKASSVTCGCDDDRQLAEDLTGDVFMRMLDALPRYRMQEQPFRAWLYRIAHNLLVDYFRKMNRQATVPLDAVEEQGAGDDPDRMIEQTLLSERLQVALMRLEPTQCEVVVLRFLAGLSLQETALTLGKTEAAIKALQHRGLSGLRQALEPLEEPVKS
jgi:RNA polymerase sigma-70 factor (ECF subfamily)